MNIDVWMHGRLSLLATTNRVINLPDGAKLGDLINLLAQEYGQEFSDEMQQDQANFMMVNGKYCRISSGRERKLEDGDIIAFLPLIAGG